MHSRYILPSLLLFSVSVQAIDTELWKRAETWEVRIDPDLNNGCFIVNYYEPGAIRLGFDQSNNYAYLMIYVRGWETLEEGKPYEIEVEFDDEGRWKAQSNAVDVNGIIALRASVVRTRFFQEFSRAKAIKVFYKNSELLRLSLVGSNQAVSEMIACQKAMRMMSPKWDT